MALGLLDQLQILRQLYLVELLGLLTSLGLLELQHLIYPRLLTEFGMLLFFTNLSLMQFSVIDGFKKFWMVKIHQYIQLMLEILHSWFYTFPAIY